jgi:hypothetical protein
MKQCSHKMVCLLVAGLLGVLALTVVMWAIAQRHRSRDISWAAMTGDLKLLKELEARGHGLNVQDPHAFGWTPLIAAVFHEQTNVIQYLVFKNVDLNIQDRNGQTALMWAMMTGDTNTVRLLLEAGADTTIKDKGGVSALGYGGTGPEHDGLLKLFNEYAYNRTNRVKVN